MNEKVYLLAEYLSKLDIFGKKIYVYEIDNGKAYIYSAKVLHLGKDYIYDDDYMLIEKARMHFFDDFNEKWFLDKQECAGYILEVERVDDIIDEDIL